MLKLKLKDVFRGEIRSKIYSQPNEHAKKTCTMRVTPKKNAKVQGVKKNGANKESFGKINEEHFTKKNMEIDEVDFSDVPVPLRASTPTPSEVNNSCWIPAVSYFVRCGNYT